MYQNPDQDLAKLWFNLSHKYNKINRPDKLVNEWATVSHFIDMPADLQNYLRAEIMASQIYDAFKKDCIAKGIEPKMIGNDNTAEFFKENIFKHGKTLSEDEIMEKITGSRLNADSFCEELNSIEIDDKSFINQIKNYQKFLKKTLSSVIIPIWKLKDNIKPTASKEK